MKFSNDDRQSITMTFDKDETVTDLAIATLIQKAENKKLWSAVAVIPIRFRNLDCFDTWREVDRTDGMCTLEKSVSLRERKSDDGQILLGTRRSG
jgi:hypothetical protein